MDESTYTDAEHCPFCGDDRGEELFSFLAIAVAGFFVGAGVVALAFYL